MNKIKGTNELRHYHDMILVPNDEGGYDCVKSRDSRTEDVYVLVMEDGSIGIKILR